MASLWTGSARSLVFCCAGVLALSSLLPFVGLAAGFADPCPEGSDCFGEGFAGFAFLLATPFAASAIVVAAVAAMRTRALAPLGRRDEGLLLWGMLILGGGIIVAALFLTKEALYEGTTRYVRGVMGPFQLLGAPVPIAPAGWVVSIIGLSRVAFRRAPPPSALPAPAT